MLTGAQCPFSRGAAKPAAVNPVIGGKGQTNADWWPNQFPDGHPNSPTHGHLKLPHPGGASMRR